MVAARALPPATPALPEDAELLVHALDRLPLEHVVRSVGAWPLRTCPRASCRAPIFVAGGGWACTSCGALGGAGAFVAAFFWDWGFDQAHAATCTGCEGCRDV